MYTALDKAIAAAVMSIIALVGLVWHPLGVSSDMVATIISIATPLLVYVWPNAPKDAP